MRDTAGRTTSLLGPLHRAAPPVTAAAAIVFLVLTWRYAGDAVAGRVDEGACTAVDALPRAGLARAIGLGSPGFVVVAAASLAGLALLLRRPRVAVLAVVGPGLTGVATTALKPLIGRTIDGDGFAFPSGHTGGAVSLGRVAAVRLIGAVPVVRPRAALAVRAGTVLLAGGVVGAGMVRIGAHYATDTIGGFCAALALGLGAAMAIDRIADRRIGGTGPAR